MGIKDLLKTLDAGLYPKSITAFAGKRIAVDASGWLHKAMYAVAEDMVDSNLYDHQFYVDFILIRTKALKQIGVEPVLVFDGPRNVLKSETSAKRGEARSGALDNGKRLLENIKKSSDVACVGKLRNECISCFQKGLSVDHEFERATIAALKRYGVNVIVAPCEADPQLAYLCHVGYCDGVLTEDSDILVYSAICGLSFPILYKFETQSGATKVATLSTFGILDHADRSSAAAYVGTDQPTSQSQSQSLSQSQGDLDTDKGGNSAFLKDLAAHFTGHVGRRMFIQTCILAGCDYCDSVHGVGIQKAMKAVQRFKDVPCDERLSRVCELFKIQGKKVPENYLQRVLRAEMLFFYHPVYNPISGRMEHMHPPNLLSSTDGMHAGGSSSCGGGTGGDNNGGMLEASLNLAVKMSSDTNATRRIMAGPPVALAELHKLGTEDEFLSKLSAFTVFEEDASNGVHNNITTTNTSISSVSSAPSSGGSCDSSSSSSSGVGHIDSSRTLPQKRAFIADVCEGRRFCRDGEMIRPHYPWDIAAHKQRGLVALATITPQHARHARNIGWAQRRNLVYALGTTPGYQHNNNNTNTGNNTGNILLPQQVISGKQHQQKLQPNNVYGAGYSRSKSSGYFSASVSASAYSYGSRTAYSNLSVSSSTSSSSSSTAAALLKPPSTVHTYFQQSTSGTVSAPFSSNSNSNCGSFNSFLAKSNSSISAVDVSSTSSNAVNAQPDNIGSTSTTSTSSATTATAAAVLVPSSSCARSSSERQKEQSGSSGSEYKHKQSIRRTVTTISSSGSTSTSSSTSSASGDIVVIDIDSDSSEEDLTLGDEDDTNNINNRSIVHNSNQMSAVVMSTSTRTNCYSYGSVVSTTTTGTNEETGAVLGAKAATAVTVSPPEAVTSLIARAAAAVVPPNSSDNRSQDEGSLLLEGEEEGCTSTIDRLAPAPPPSRAELQTVKVVKNSTTTSSSYDRRSIEARVESKPTVVSATFTAAAPVSNANTNKWFYQDSDDEDDDDDDDEDNKNGSINIVPSSSSSSSASVTPAAPFNKKVKASNVMDKTVYAIRSVTVDENPNLNDAPSGSSSTSIITASKTGKALLVPSGLNKEDLAVVPTVTPAARTQLKRPLTTTNVTAATVAGTGTVSVIAAKKRKLSAAAAAAASTSKSIKSFFNAVSAVK